MATLTLYGSSVADVTFTNACDMVLNTSGGVETSKTTTISGGSGNFAEMTSKGGTVAAVSAIPAIPTGKGWLYKPGAGSFAAGNWSASCAFKEASDNTNTEIRFLKFDGVSTYTLIGTISSNTIIGSSRTVVNYAATSMTGFSTLSTDYIYVDEWWQDSAGASGDSPIVFMSTTAVNGVTSDMQITTSNFTPTVTSHTRISDGLGGLFS